MKIISVINLKGGAGKTTTAVNLAGALGVSGLLTAVLDLDEQRSATMWSQRAKDVASHVQNSGHQSGVWKGFQLSEDVTPLDMSENSAAVLKEALGDLQNRDIVILDTPPQIARSSTYAALLADLVIMPVTPSILDIWAGTAPLETVREAREERGGLPACLILPSRWVRTQMAAEALAALVEMGEEVGPIIYNRTAVSEAVVTGKTLQSYAYASESAGEFRALSGKVQEVLGL